MTTPRSFHHRIRRRLLALAIGSLCTACIFDETADPFPTATETDGSSSTTDAVSSSTDVADDTQGDSTATSTTGPDGCPPAVFDVSLFDEACFQ